jgi:ADP-ribose pyrophosphatase YjhB (NUDIX family)
MNIRLLFLCILVILVSKSKICMPMSKEADEYMLGKETSPSHIVFCSDKFDPVGMIDSDEYKKMVEKGVISCIDAFVVDLQTNTYFIITRKDEPAKGFQWIPGGRQEKFSSITETARCKCKKEVGIDVEVHETLGSWSTVFPRSAWDCPTHTTNTVVLAFSKSQNCNLDGHHENGCWISLETEPENIYLKAIYKKALEALKAYKISRLHQAVLAQNHNLEEIKEAHKLLSNFPKTNINELVEGKRILERVLTLSQTDTSRKIIELLLESGAKFSSKESARLKPGNLLHKMIATYMRARKLKGAASFEPIATSSYCTG